MSISRNDEQLLNENQASTFEHAEVQATVIAELEAELVRLRGAVIRRDTELACERERYAQLVASIPSLPKRFELAARVKALTERIESMRKDTKRNSEKPDVASFFAPLHIGN
jgi:hypothetical protein